ncbi:hypothetical protein [Nostoc sp. CMAA1605]|uniref:hypothetical protein n=1 Tax=Nostoc sp. CMAA1605 TaxID=2055159 RepID=UPI001F206436|nr:hypothetical protein [Nostoc sp. CMAA1605]
MGNRGQGRFYSDAQCPMPDAQCPTTPDTLLIKAKLHQKNTIDSINELPCGRVTRPYPS